MSDAQTFSPPAARIPLLALEEMTPVQRAIHDAVVSGPRRRMIGPLLAAIHIPELATHWSNIGHFLRFDTSLPASLTELAIVAVGRRWTSQVEWWIHARIAVTAGVPRAVIDAIAQLESPVFEDPAAFEVYEFTRELQLTGQVSDAVYAAIDRRWQTRGSIELTALIGYYTMVAMTLNAHRIAVPEPHEPLSKVADLAKLAPGRVVGEVD